MKIAIVGYGKMGHAIEATAVGRGHTVVCTADTSAEMSERMERIRTADVAIEFSQPTAAADNLRRCLDAGVAVVCGTTGWYDQYDDIVALCRRVDGALLTASNFSIGMNIMFDLNRRLAALMRNRPEYHAGITETHHVHKLDAPSGTALTLREQTGRPDMPITSIREGEVAGIHTVRYDSEADSISLTHEAHSRQGFALGAILAAEFLNGRRGVYTMTDVINQQL